MLLVLHDGPTREVHVAAQLPHRCRDSTIRCSIAVLNIARVAFTIVRYLLREPSIAVEEIRGTRFDTSFASESVPLAALSRISRQATYQLANGIHPRNSFSVSTPRRARSTLSRYASRC